MSKQLESCLGVDESRGLTLSSQCVDAEAEVSKVAGVRIDLETSRRNAQKEMRDSGDVGALGGGAFVDLDASVHGAGGKL